MTAITLIRLSKIANRIVITIFQDELCWNMNDIEYLKSNSRSKNVEPISDWLGQEYVDKLLEWNKADWMLYKHFNATFTQKV